MIEYVIWGITPEGIDEQVLLTEVQGEKIRDEEIAKKAMKVLEVKYGARALRIQKIDMSEGLDWNEAVKEALR